MKQINVQRCAALVEDAIALKVMNGWYGDPLQGDTTEAEDKEALNDLQRMDDAPIRELVAIVEKLPQPATHDGLRLADALAKTRKSLDESLETVAVHTPYMWENDNGPKGWYAVSTDDGIVAYFRDEKAAFYFRLALINASLNPIA